VKLTSEEQAILAGERGEAPKRALEYQVKVARFWGARRFVPVTNVHMMGDIEVMGDAGLRFLRDEAALGARCVVGATTNARCADFAHCARLGQDPTEIAKEKELIACLEKMDVITTDTCINYQTVYQPHVGEHVAWGDTGTVIYANSVFGARSNFESGPAALAAALTGRTPEYGFHLDAHRRGTFTVELTAALGDLADWGAVGKLVGEGHQNYYAVPVFHGFRGTPKSDELKHLGAALASYGSMGMFHFVGATPEAPSVEAALGGRTPAESMSIGDADLQQVYDGYDLGDGDARLVVFSGPQQSLLEGVCFYILQNLSAMRAANRWTNMVSNSAKIVNIIGAHRFNTILRRTAECVEIACTGALR
jgi:predicted aconitase